MRTTIILPLVLITALTLAACKPITAPPATNTTSSVPPPVTAPNDGVVQQPVADGVMAKPAAGSSYVPFTQAAYDAAKASGQPTMLYFYATWCPICARQEPIIVDLFNGGEIADLGIAAFRVNFNDPETDADERALAERFGISYQHTFVLLDASGAVRAKFTGQQSKAQLVSALKKIK